MSNLDKLSSANIEINEAGKELLKILRSFIADTKKQIKDFALDDIKEKLSSLTRDDDGFNFAISQFKEYAKSKGFNKIDEEVINVNRNIIFEKYKNLIGKIENEIKNKELIKAGKSEKVDERSEEDVIPFGDGEGEWNLGDFNKYSEKIKNYSEAIGSIENASVPNVIEPLTEPTDPASVVPTPGTPEEPTNATGITTSMETIQSQPNPESTPDLIEKGSGAKEEKVPEKTSIPLPQSESEKKEEKGKIIEINNKIKKSEDERKKLEDKLAKVSLLGWLNPINWARRRELEDINFNIVKLKRQKDLEEGRKEKDKTSGEFSGFTRFMAVDKERKEKRDKYKLSINESKSEESRKISDLRNKITAINNELKTGNINSDEYEILLEQKKIGEFRIKQEKLRKRKERKKLAEQVPGVDGVWFRFVRGLNNPDTYKKGLISAAAGAGMFAIMSGTMGAAAVGAPAALAFKGFIAGSVSNLAFNEYLRRRDLDHFQNSEHKNTVYSFMMAGLSGAIGATAASVVSNLFSVSPAQAAITPNAPVEAKGVLDEPIKVKIINEPVVEPALPDKIDTNNKLDGDLINFDDFKVKNGTSSVDVFEHLLKEVGSSQELNVKQTRWLAEKISKELEIRNLNTDQVNNLADILNSSKRGSVTEVFRSIQNGTITGEKINDLNLYLKNFFTLNEIMRFISLAQKK